MKEKIRDLLVSLITGRETKWKKLDAYSKAAWLPIFNEMFYMRDEAASNSFSKAGFLLRVETEIANSQGYTEHVVKNGYTACSAHDILEEMIAISQNKVDHISAIVEEVIQGMYEQNGRDIIKELREHSMLESKAQCAIAIHNGVGNMPASANALIARDYNRHHASRDTELADEAYKLLYMNIMKKINSEAKKGNRFHSYEWHVPVRFRRIPGLMNEIIGRASARLIRAGYHACYDSRTINYQTIAFQLAW